MKLFEEPEYLKKMQRGKEDLLSVLTPKAEKGLWKNEESALGLIAMASLLLLST